MILRIKHNVDVIVDDDAPVDPDLPWEQYSIGYVGALVEHDGQPAVLLLHHLVHGPVDPGWLVVHANNNKLDNRRDNLTAVRYQPYRTRRSGPNKNNTTGIRGIHHVPNLSATRPWRAQIGADHQHYHLGLWPTRDEAVAVRRAAELCFFGTSDE